MNRLILLKQQLEDFFFENRYSDDNEKNSIGFDKKIIVIEDIDCLGDIVSKRKNDKEPVNAENDVLNNIILKGIVSSINENNNETSNDDKNSKLIDVLKQSNNDEKISLDDILNLWDGIRETPGRLMIISSNHYFNLDPALIRPGRIDITLELNNATHSIIRDMYHHLFKTNIDESELMKIKKGVHSPAEIVNIFFNSNNDSNVFMKIMKEK